MRPLCLYHSSLIVAQPPLSATLTATASSIFLGRLPPSIYSRILRSLSTRRTSAALRTCSFSALADAWRSILQVNLSWSKSSPMVCWEPGHIMLRARGIVRNGEDIFFPISSNTIFTPSALLGKFSRSTVSRLPF